MVDRNRMNQEKASSLLSPSMDATSKFEKLDIAQQEAKESLEKFIEQTTQIVLGPSTVGEDDSINALKTMKII